MARHSFPAGYSRAYIRGHIKERGIERLPGQLDHFLGHCEGRAPVGTIHRGGLNERIARIAGAVVFVLIAIATTRGSHPGPLWWSLCWAAQTIFKIDIPAIGFD